MALTVGELRATLTADRSRYSREIKLAAIDAKQFKQTAERPVDVKGDASDYLRALNQARAERRRFLLESAAAVTRIGGMATVGGLGVLGGQAAVGGALALAAGLKQVAGAAALVPAAGVAAAAGIATITIAMEGMGEAAKNAGDPAKWAESLRDLSPEAQAVARAVKGMGGAWNEARRSIQDDFWAGLADDIDKTGRLYIPVLDRGLGNVASSMNTGAGGFLEWLRGSDTLGDVALILDNTAASFREAAPAGTAFAQILRDVVAEGSERLPYLADGLDSVAQRWANMVEQARASGELGAWIERGMSTAGDVGGIVGNIGGTIGGILDAGQASGAGALQTIRDLTAGMEEWAKSADGQGAAAGFLTAARDAGQALLPVVEAVAETLGGDLAPALAEIGANAAPEVADAVTAAGDAFAAAAPGAVDLADAGSDLLGAVTPLLPILGEVAGVAATILAPGLEAAAAAVGLTVDGFDALPAPIQMALVAAAAWALMGDRVTRGAGAMRDRLAAPWRQFGQEMRLQQALLTGSSQIASRQVARTRLALEALAARYPGARAGIAGIGAAYDRTSSAAQRMADRVALAAGVTTEAMGRRAAGAIERGGQRVAAGMEAMGRGVTGTGRRIVTVLDATGRAADRALTVMREAPARVGAAWASGMGTVRTSTASAVAWLQRLPAAAGTAQAMTVARIEAMARGAVGAVDDGMARMVERTRSGWSTVTTAVGVGALSVVDRARQMATGVVQAVQTIPTAVGVAALSAVDKVGAIPAAIGSGVRSVPTIVGNATRGAADRVRDMASRIGTAVTTGVGHLGRLGSAASGAVVAGLNAAKGAAGGLMGALGGPWGAAITGATVLLGIWAAQSAKAKAEQQALADAGRSYADVLREQQGVLNDSVRQAAAKSLEDAKVLEHAQRLGISLPRVTDAFVHQGGALDSLVSSLDSMIEAGKEFEQVDDGMGGSTTAWSGRLSETGEAAQALKANLLGLVDASGGAVASNERVASASGAAGSEMTAAGQAAEGMARSVDGAAGRVEALTSALDALRGDTMTLEEATQRANDGVREMGDGWKAAAAEAKSAGTGILDARGAINTTTEAGSALQDMVQELASAYGQVYSATLDATGSQEQAAKAAGVYRDAFVKAATAALGNADAAEALANSYGLLPEMVNTDVTTTGMSAAQIGMDLLRGKVVAVPDKKGIVVSSNAAPHISLIERLGFKVTKLPNGRFRIDANTADAQGALDGFISRNSNRVIRVNVVTGQGSAGAGGRVPTMNAVGRVMEYYAAGGMRPMSGGSAAVVGSFRRTGAMRVIGDNPTHDELFVPLDPFSQRSQQLLDEGIKRMRPDWWAAMKGSGQQAGGGYAPVGPAVTAAGGGRSVTINNYGPDAAQVAREVRAQMQAEEMLYGGA